jgi:hypothetical protein
LLGERTETAFLKLGQFVSAVGISIADMGVESRVAKDEEERLPLFGDNLSAIAWRGNEWAKPFIVIVRSSCKTEVALFHPLLHCQVDAHFKKKIVRKSQLFPCK